MNGLPRTLANTFGRSETTGRNRFPSPPAKMTAVMSAKGSKRGDISGTTANSRYIGGIVDGLKG